MRIRIDCVPFLFDWSKIYKWTPSPARGSTVDIQRGTRSYYLSWSRLVIGINLPSIYAIKQRARYRRDGMM